ncbi:MAG: hypothetical protein EB084_15660 [Proteobacteria bacterium]|nr:hypothetical protein [Pseudomonadota bacterium]
MILHVIYTHDFLYNLVFPGEPTVDDFTHELTKFRRLIDPSRHDPTIAHLIAKHEKELNQFEWEHVRCLEQAGFPNHPFIIEKKRRSLPPHRWHELEPPQRESA